ncbi:glutamate-cysteine ligase family protein [Rhodopirellula sp. MGV]|uniref:carboxylate-amine ligase n=1 Tax=Rhodopirellula sp. MGV TaxID=2023130 RepID=UPI000B9777CC|nr:glutamate-cysteine ligase family protein [Rhodopirellula sp. MGV]OYP31143.1 glutamate--cysteine ligase [Rhodopirellula sp. MGV]PNY36033.1 glutamate--cysteine ligase [Rhodopirellula baltica]
MALKLFEAFGIELEYMLVGPQTLAVRPMADSFLARLSDGRVEGEVERGDVSWSNELALHVLELKATQPTADLPGLVRSFQGAIASVQSELDRCQLRLLPTAMHPTMEPRTDVVLWPHEYHEVYDAFDKKFDCHSHGWGNVQSVHLNLPFDGDAEFERLHTAIRLVLPLLPALAASSPVVDGRETGLADTRLHHYVRHCNEMPCLMGEVIPEPLRNQDEYDSVVYQPIRDALQLAGWSESMRPEFLNARGAIARFDRGSIEIRVMDVQEFPEADVAICAAVVALLKLMTSEHWQSMEQQFAVPTKTLRHIFDDVIVDGEKTVLDDAQFLACFGCQKSTVTAVDLWRDLLEQIRESDETVAELFAPLQTILDHGTLSTRIRRVFRRTFDQADIAGIYQGLARCLLQGKSYVA